MSRSVFCRHQQTEAELKDLGKFREQQRSRLEASNAQIGECDADLAKLEESKATVLQTTAAKQLVRSKADTL